MKTEMIDRWKKLKEEMLRKINELDDLTPWAPTEPDWWLEMMDVKKLLLDGSKEFIACKRPGIE